MGQISMENDGGENGVVENKGRDKGLEIVDKNGSKSNEILQYKFLNYDPDHETNTKIN